MHSFVLHSVQPRFHSVGMGVSELNMACKRQVSQTIDAGIDEVVTHLLVIT